MLNFDRTTYVVTLLMACWLGLSVVMGWWLTCAVTVAALGRISWVAHRAWQAERRAAEDRAQESLSIYLESVALFVAIAERHPNLLTEQERSDILRWPARVKIAALGSPG